MTHRFETSMSRRSLLRTGLVAATGLGATLLVGREETHSAISPQIVGPTLVTTIDSNVQLALNQAMIGGVREAGLPASPPFRGAAVALDPNTGEILAMISRPGFSPDETTDTSLWAADEAADRRDAFRARRLNRAVQGYYPPGSIFKTLTAATALEAGVDPVFDYRSGEKGPRQPDGIEHLGLWHRLDLPHGSPIECGNHPPGADWTFDLGQAYAWSCNVAFSELALRVGASAIADMAHRFGLEREISVDGIGSFTSTLDSQPGRPTSERFFAKDESNLARTSFGQGQVLMTPLQVALMFAGIANDGRIMQPYVIAGRRDPGSGTWLSRSAPRPLLDTSLTPKSLRRLQQLTHDSATYGWARTARVNDSNAHPGVSGKTGSAEWNALQPSHAWFGGFFPSERPSIVLAVVIERGGAGPIVAVQVAHDFFSSKSMAEYSRAVD